MPNADGSNILSEWTLIFQGNHTPLNQRVQGSSPCAPTSKINNLLDDLPANLARIQFLSDPASDLSPCVRGPQSLSGGRRIGSLSRTRTRPPRIVLPSDNSGRGRGSSSSASGTAHQAEDSPSIPKVSGPSRARSGLIARQSCSTNHGRSIRKSVGQLL